MWGGFKLICCREFLVEGMPFLVALLGSREKVEGRREWEIVRKSLSKINLIYPLISILLIVV